LAIVFIASRNWRIVIMSTRRRACASHALGVIVAVALVCVSIVLVSASPATQQKPPAAPKLDKDQLQDAQALKAVLDAVQSGQAAPSDFAVAIESYSFFKTAAAQTYVPFTLTVDGKALTDPSVALMFRVVSRDARPAGDLSGLRDETGDARAKLDAAKKGALAPSAYDDLEFTALKPAEAPAPAGTTPPAGTTQAAPVVRMSRAFQVNGGEYDVYLALKERNPSDKKKPKVAICKRTITVPDFNGPDIGTSSVVVSDKIGPLAKPLTPQQQRENPYTIGQLEIVPKVGTEFAKTQELNVFFQIYNPGLDAARKPDVLVEFTFVQKQPDGTEKKIANSEPQILNGNTLPPQFDITKHQLVGGSAWPLEKFKTGTFRVDIKITDKVSGKILVRSADFAVS
jgi:hypothetical protein